MMLVRNVKSDMTPSRCEEIVGHTVSSTSGWQTTTTNNSNTIVIYKDDELYELFCKFLQLKYNEGIHDGARKMLLQKFFSKHKCKNAILQDKVAICKIAHDEYVVCKTYNKSSLYNCAKVYIDGFEIEEEKIPSADYTLSSGNFLYPFFKKIWDASDAGKKDVSTNSFTCDIKEFMQRLPNERFILNDKLFVDYYSTGFIIATPNPSYYINDEEIKTIKRVKLVVPQEKLKIDTTHAKYGTLDWQTTWTTSSQNIFLDEKKRFFYLFQRLIDRFDGHTSYIYYRLSKLDELEIKEFTKYDNFILHAMRNDVEVSFLVQFLPTNDLKMTKLDLQKAKYLSDSYRNVYMFHPDNPAYSRSIKIQRPIEYYTEKQKLKQEAKKNNKKFIIGRQYKLKNKSVFSVKEKVYICKKFIHTMNDTLVEIVIMKCLHEQPDEDIYTLSKNDCEKIHLKYEPGLQVFSMKEPFKLIKIC